MSGSFACTGATPSLGVLELEKAESYLVQVLKRQILEFERHRYWKISLKFFWGEPLRWCSESLLVILDSPELVVQCQEPLDFILLILCGALGNLGHWFSRDIPNHALGSPGDDGNQACVGLMLESIEPSLTCVLYTTVLPPGPHSERKFSGRETPTSF